MKVMQILSNNYQFAGATIPTTVGKGKHPPFISSFIFLQKNSPTGKTLWAKHFT